MIKNFLQAGFGGVTNQMIVFLSLPLIARLYEPAAYASWVIVMATASIFGSVACFRYELAIVTTGTEDDASSLFWACVLSALVFGLLILVGYVIYAQQTYFNIDNSLLNVRHHFIFISLMTAMTGINVTLQSWNTRHKMFMYNSLALVILSITTVSIQLLWAVKISPTPYGLLLGSLGGVAAAIACQLISMITSRNIPVFHQRIFKRVLPCLKQQKRFLQYSTPYTVFGLIRDRATTLVMQAFLPMQAVGVYALSYRVMNFPGGFVGNALRPVFFQACSAQGVGLMESKMNRVLKWLVVLVVPFMVIYFNFADDLFVLFFGAQWKEAGYLGKFIIFPAATSVLIGWMDRIMDVLGQQKLTLLLEVIFSTLSISGLWLGFMLGWGLPGALMVQCGVVLTYHFVYLFSVYYKAQYDCTKLIPLAPIAVVMALVSVIAVQMIKMVIRAI